MHSLESLDLSGNNLSGMIPQSMSALTFLSHLNLSHNNLSGRIPTGSQLQTLNDPSIYTGGDNQLCGGPLAIRCNSDQVLQLGRNAEEDEDDDSVEKMWIYGVTSGFITGFMGILGILALMSRWRRALFNFVGEYILKTIWSLVHGSINDLLKEEHIIMQKLLWVDGFFLLLILAATHLSCCSCSGCFDHEWRALLRFKRSVSSEPPGLLSSWNGEKNCCEWEGVECDNATGHVTGLHLGRDPLDITPELKGNKLDLCLAELTHLSYMDLSGNDFHGIRIPDFIGSMRQLRFLDLSSAGFSGVVPPVIGNLSSLRVLHLSYNPELVVDDFTWFSNLLSLQHLDLSGLSLGIGKAWNLDKVLLSMIPSLIELRLSECKLSNSHFNHHLNLTLSTIQTLDLHLNSIGGNFPHFLQNLTSLRVLDLSNNKLNSSIPVMNNIVELDLSENKFPRIQDVGVWSFSRLKSLDLSFNDMEGELVGPGPSSNVSRFALETLRLSYNRFCGEIPTSLQRLTSLTSLYLDNNKLTGKIPEALGYITSLQELYLTQNQLTGSIPASLGNLMMLQKLDLSSNLLLNGTIPDTIGKLSKLEFLDISNASLSGVITKAHFANTSMLKRLYATSNHRLSFKISHDWNPPFQIIGINLRSCRIESEFPPWIRTQKSLVLLNLSNTSIYGPLPDWLHDLPAIINFDLSHNFLDGPLTNLPFTQRTDMLVLKNNLFNGSIPKSLCNATKLNILDLSRNMLSGILPECIGDLRILKAMILSSNRLSGVIPSSLGNLGSSLEWLQLNNNSFHGQLPDTLANCTSLTVLDLGENQLFGNIPKWIHEKFEFLRVLRLHTNGFKGQIPIALCGCTNLQIIDLGANNLTGPIPVCFQNMLGMTRVDSNLYFSGGFDQSLIQVVGGVPLEYTTTLGMVVNMDLSSNKLIGEIPEELVLLTGLLGLNLSNNHLMGHIPYRIGDMHSLISLDLSQNNLSGMIPQSMSRLTFLSHLNLSHNNLSGRIPTGDQLQTLIDPSIYAGNSQLCGGPLPHKCKSYRVPQIGRNTEEEDDDVWKMWIYGVTSGFITGFMVIVGILALVDRWRNALFYYVGGWIGKEL
ncbi:hypothetical protein Lser_V15G09423 [Lactuca serriola]